MATSAGQPLQRKQAIHMRPHVLIVTNDPDLRDFLQEGLLFGGFWVSVIASGVQTLEVFRLRTFDLVLVDADLPGLSSSELIRRLRSAPSNAGDTRTDVPVLLIVADDREIEREARHAGADAVLAPPIELDSLIPLLHSTIEEWRRRHPDRPWADQAAQLRPVD